MARSFLSLLHHRSTQKQIMHHEEASLLMKTFRCWVHRALRGACAGLQKLLPNPYWEFYCRFFSFSSCSCPSSCVFFRDAFLGQFPQLLIRQLLRTHLPVLNVISTHAQGKAVCHLDRSLGDLCTPLTLGQSPEVTDEILCTSSARYIHTLLGNIAPSPSEVLHRVTDVAILPELLSVFSVSSSAAAPARAKVRFRQ